MDQATVIAVDLNGTLAEGLGPDAATWGDPLPGAVAAMKELANKDYTLCINSVVGDTDGIALWLNRHDIPWDHINESPAQPEGSSDKLNAVAYIDDRAIPFRGDWDETLHDLYDSGVLDKSAKGRKRAVIAVVEKLAIHKRQKGQATSIHDDDGRTVVFVMTSGRTDRDGETVDPAGGDFSEYALNPTVQFNHDTDTFGIGSLSSSLAGLPPDGKQPVADGLAVWVDEIGEGTPYEQAANGAPLGARRPALLGKVYFSKVTEKARDAFGMVKEGTLGGGSISFLPLDGTSKNSDGGNHYERWKLLEFTICPVGSNPDAVALTKRLKVCYDGKCKSDTSNYKGYWLTIVQDGDHWTWSVALGGSGKVQADGASKSEDSANNEARLWVDGKEASMKRSKPTRPTNEALRQMFGADAERLKEEAPEEVAAWEQARAEHYAIESLGERMRNRPKFEAAWQRLQDVYRHLSKSKRQSPKRAEDTPWGVRWKEDGAWQQLWFSTKDEAFAQRGKLTRLGKDQDMQSTYRGKSVRKRYDWYKGYQLVTLGQGTHDLWDWEVRDRKDNVVASGHEEPMPHRLMEDQAAFDAAKAWVDSQKKSKSPLPEGEVMNEIGSAGTLLWGWVNNVVRWLTGPVRAVVADSIRRGEEGPMADALDELFSRGLSPKQAAQELQAKHLKGPLHGNTVPELSDWRSLDVGEVVVARSLILMPDGSVFARSGERLHIVESYAHRMPVAQNSEGEQRAVTLSDVRRPRRGKNMNKSAKNAEIRAYTSEYGRSYGVFDKLTGEMLSGPHSSEGEADKARARMGKSLKRKLWTNGNKAWLLKSEGPLDKEMEDYLEDRGLDDVQLQDVPPTPQVQPAPTPPPTKPEKVEDYPPSKSDPSGGEWREEEMEEPKHRKAGETSQELAELYMRHIPENERTATTAYEMRRQLVAAGVIKSNSRRKSIEKDGDAWGEATRSNVQRFISDMVFAGMSARAAVDAAKEKWDLKDISMRGQNVENIAKSKRRKSIGAAEVDELFSFLGKGAIEEVVETKPSVMVSFAPGTDMNEVAQRLAGMGVKGQIEGSKLTISGDSSDAPKEPAGEPIGELPPELPAELPPETPPKSLRKARDYYPKGPLETVEAVGKDGESRWHVVDRNGDKITRGFKTEAEADEWIRDNGPPKKRVNKEVQCREECLETTYSVTLSGEYEPEQRAFSTREEAEAFANANGGGSVSEHRVQSPSKRLKLLLRKGHSLRSAKRKMASEGADMDAVEQAAKGYRDLQVEQDTDTQRWLIRNDEGNVVGSLYGYSSQQAAEDAMSGINGAMKSQKCACGKANCACKRNKGLAVDLYQGLDEQDRKFGYVTDGDGGYFFTWMDSLDATLNSLDPDDTDEPSFSKDEAREVLQQRISGKFDDESKSKRLSKAERDEWKTVAEYLSDTAENAPHHLAAGMKYHAENIKRKLENAEKVTKEPELSEEEQANLDTAMKELADTTESLEKSVFRATGQRIASLDRLRRN